MHVQSVGLLLLLSVSLALAIVGALLMKTRFLDKKLPDNEDLRMRRGSGQGRERRALKSTFVREAKTKAPGAKKSASGSVTAGRYMVIFGSLMTVVSLAFLWLNMTGFFG